MIKSLIACSNQPPLPPPPSCSPSCSPLPRYPPSLSPPLCTPTLLSIPLSSLPPSLLLPPLSPPSSLLSLPPLSFPPHSSPSPFSLPPLPPFPSSLFFLSFPSFPLPTAIALSLPLASFIWFLHWDPMTWITGDAMIIIPYQFHLQPGSELIILMQVLFLVYLYSHTIKTLWRSRYIYIRGKSRYREVTSWMLLLISIVVARH